MWATERNRFIDTIGGAIDDYCSDAAGGSLIRERVDGHSSKKMAEPIELAPPDCWMDSGGFAFLHGLCRALNCGLLCRLRLILGCELLLDLGGDCGHVHLVDVGGVSEHFAGIACGLSGIENYSLHQKTPENAFLRLADESC